MIFETQVFTVSQLNRQVRNFLERDIGEIHVEGEISNLMQPASGHFYFTLKDDQAQLRCVFFKNRHHYPAKKIVDGQHIVAKGKLSLYETRGDYQLIIDRITDTGLGKLHQQFEELKQKLSSEGLFENQRKKKPPLFPEYIGVITSLTGAAVRDILTTLTRRYPFAKILIFPSEVQGNQAYKQLINAIVRAEKDKRSDVLILARGGGSLEDLWAFNHELLARKIASCSIPIVSGVGHETDFTIADFVSDLRAATPTAAAESVAPDTLQLMKCFNQFHQQFYSTISKQMQHHELKLNHLRQKIASPGRLIFGHWQTIDFLERRLRYSFSKCIHHRQHQLQLYLSRLQNQNPKFIVKHALARLNALNIKLGQCMQNKLNQLKQHLSVHLSTLHAVSPLATLERGYAIALHDKKVLFSSKQIVPGNIIDVQLSQGHLTCNVLKTGD
ncbi:exodeoxyribonuclease VII large subunit [Legionella israelensis]|uniref:Exodeoxyribonuclease 7 large subunit n=1 Tax=Legionella israelensis TaxID=454 RepID=A0A0W0WS48_9GAMM|nr:exodeoxyribonuclease VII large subunit [Legionella israelensis]KTD35144.1 exonuclease VII large subunit [Legionella israelensis]QBS08700.1 exodeoxyribonuclease VII large subunit [Legionella israelensis]SCY01084.1 Exodeoxyribonuclease VII large subunit [Legionella israelensis DSM 19235]STX58371.1 exonuclease VII large subunit [Legionella israelensis]